MKIAINKATATNDRSPPDRSERRFTRFPGGLASTSTPEVNISDGFVSINFPSPPGNNREKTSSNSLAVSSYASVNIC